MSLHFVATLLTFVTGRPSTAVYWIPPYELMAYRQTHHILGLCCLFPLDKGMWAFVEPMIFLVTLGQFAGEYVAACASASRCSYMGDIQELSIISICLLTAMSWKSVPMECMFHFHRLLIQVHPEQGTPYFFSQLLDVNWVCHRDWRINPSTSCSSVRNQSADCAYAFTSWLWHDLWKGPVHTWVSDSCSQEKIATNWCTWKILVQRPQALWYNIVPPSNFNWIKRKWVWVNCSSSLMPGFHLELWAHSSGSSFTNVSVELSWHGKHSIHMNAWRL